MATADQPTQGGSGDGPIWVGRVFFGVVSVLLLLISFYWNELGKPWGPGTSAFLAYLLFAVYLGLLYGRVSPMEPLVWVPIGILLFYFGIPVAIEWLGVQSEGGYDPWGTGNAPIVARGYCVALFALASFLWGVHLSGVADLSEPPPPGTVQDRSLAAPALLFTLGALTMTAVGIAIVGPSNLFGLYHDWWDSKLLGADQRFVDVGLNLTAAGVYALLASDESIARWRRWFAYGILALCLFIALQKGDRTAMVTLGVGAGWCYSQRVGRVGWTPVLVAAFVGLVAFPVIREWRAERSIEESKRASVMQLFGESVYSLGNGVNAIVYTVEFIPKTAPYALGSSFARAAVSAVPNVGLSKGASWKKADVEDSPSSWLTWLVNPVWAAQGGGYGFAMAAEWHYNFGLVGVLLGMTLTGFGVARARNACRRSSLALVWSATLFAAVSIWIRNVIGYALKVAIWPVIGLWVIRRLVLLLRGRARHRAQGHLEEAAGSLNA